MCSYLCKKNDTYELALENKLTSEIKRMLLIRNISMVEAVATIYQESHYSNYPTVEYLNFALPDERIFKKSRSINISQKY